MGFPFLIEPKAMTGHRLLPKAGDAGPGNAANGADQGGGGSPALHGAQRWTCGETRLVAKRSRAAAEAVSPLRQGAGTGPQRPTSPRPPTASICPRTGGGSCPALTPSPRLQDRTPKQAP